MIDKKTKHYIPSRTISESLEGELNPFFGKQHSEETKIKISKFNKGKNTGENNHAWKGGMRANPDGYLRYPDDSYVHRRVMEKELGRLLLSSEFVHHINNNTSDNRPENLELTTNSEHRKEHCKTQERNERGRFI